MKDLFEIKRNKEEENNQIADILMNRLNIVLEELSIEFDKVKKFNLYRREE